MADVAVASIEIDSDWGTLQLTSSGATLKAIDGLKYPTGTIFTPTGVVYGQPNKTIQAQQVKLSVQILASGHTVDFITGHGNRGKAGPAAGCITVSLADHEYRNAGPTGDGLNIKAFNDVPLYGSEYDSE